MKKFVIFICALFLLVGSPVFAQTVIGTSTTNPRVGEPVTVYAQSPAGCTGFSVTSWSFLNETPSTNPNPLGTSLSFFATYPSIGNKSITVSYRCQVYQAPGSGQQQIGYTNTDTEHIDVSPLNPNFTLTLGDNDICETSGLTFEAINLVSPGSSPEFTFKIDNTSGPVVFQGVIAPSGGVAIYTKNAPLNLSPGTHTAYAMMYSSMTSTTTTWKSASFVVREKQSFSVATPNGFHINGVVCQANPVAPVSVLVNDPHNLGFKGFRYHWYINGGESGATTTNYYTYPSVSQDDELKVVIIDEFGNGCQESQATSYPIYVDVTSTQWPTTHIVASKTSFGAALPEDYPLCHGTSIYLRSSQQAESYSWSLSGGGVSFGSSQQISLTVSSNTQSVGTFTSDRLITLAATGLSGGTCVTSPSSSTVFLSGSQFDIKSPPPSTFSPSGNVLIRTDATQTFNGPSPTTGMTYQWLKKSGSTFVPVTPTGSETGKARTYTTNVEGTYKLKTTTPLGCTATSIAEAILKVNHRPYINAGPDIDFNLPDVPTITAAGGDEEGPVAYSWTLLSGPTSNVTGTSTATISIPGAAVGIYKFKVDVTDGLGEKSSGGDEVACYVYPYDNYNFVRENVVTIPNVKETSNVSSLTIGNRVQTTTYFDGFGRPIQEVRMKATPGSKDLTQTFEYDKYGREVYKYLPYPTTQTTGVFIGNTVRTSENEYSASPHYNFYSGSIADVPGYAELKYDDSPLNAIVEQASPGNSWKMGSGHTTTKLRLINTGHEVLLFQYDEGTSKLSLPANPSSDEAYYPANSLYLSKSTDEENHEVREFFDKEKRVVCKMVQAPTGYACTYYIYDDFGNLVVVVPPEAVKQILESTQN